MEEHRWRHARLGRRSRSRRRRRHARAARPRSDRVDGQSRRGRVLRPARTNDGHQRVRHVHVYECLHAEGNRALSRPHVPRSELRSDPAARGRQRNLGTGVPGKRTQREALQGLRPRGRTAQRSPHVAFLRKSHRAGHRTHDAHGHELRVPAAEQVHPPGPARRRLPRLSGSQDHRLPHGVAAPRGTHGARGEAHEPLPEPFGHHRLARPGTLPGLPHDRRGAPVGDRRQDRHGSRSRLRRHAPRGELHPQPRDA